MKRKIVITPSGSSFEDTFIVEDCTIDELPESEYKENYKKFYTVKLYGRIALWLAKGMEGCEREIVAFYPNGEFWSGYGTNFPDAIENALKDAWRYMGNANE